MYVCVFVYNVCVCAYVYVRAFVLWTFCVRACVRLRVCVCVCALCVLRVSAYVRVCLDSLQQHTVRHSCLSAQRVYL